MHSESSELQTPSQLRAQRAKINLLLPTEYTHAKMFVV